MPVLKNTKQERFVQERAKGKSLGKAYALAGYKPDQGNPTKMAARPEIKARLQEITETSATKVGVTVERIIAELARIGFADITDAVEFADGRVTLADSTKLPRDVTAAIAEVKQNVGGGVSIKFHDKQAALINLGKQLGMFREAQQDGGLHGITLADLVTMSYEVGRKAGASETEPRPVKTIEHED